MRSIGRTLALWEMLALLVLAGHAAERAPAADEAVVKATGKPAEGPAEAFLGEPFFDMQLVFEGNGNVREPYLAVAVDGAILVVRNNLGHLRRSEDGGKTWSGIVEVPIRHSDSNIIVDETTGDLLSIRIWDGRDRMFRSKDGGKTWKEEPVAVLTEELTRRSERVRSKKRTTRAEEIPGKTYFLHANASEAGITLRRGKHRGRLIVTATFRPHAKEHPSDRKEIDAIYSCALYSDDGGKTWSVSDLFPEGYTEEAGLVELWDGRIYYNTRSHKGFYDKSRARPLGPDAALRREAWSHDGGQTWADYRISKVLPDGGGYDRGYGMKGGLVRLPIAGRDVLIYSNADTAGGPREKLTVWASFDGGRTWPVKRLVNAGPAAYSSLGAGRPGTPGEGRIFLLFEGGPEGRYSAMHVARFNLSWILEGQGTGDGQLPEWIAR